MYKDKIVDWLNHPLIKHLWCLKIRGYFSRQYQLYDRISFREGNVRFLERDRYPRRCKRYRPSCAISITYTYAYVCVSRQVLRYLLNLITLPYIIWHNKIHPVQWCTWRCLEDNLLLADAFFASSLRENIDSGRWRRNLRGLESLARN